MLVKNRKPGVLEPNLVGPFIFVHYKDFDKYACVLEDQFGNRFDCSVAHIVPVDGETFKKKR